MTARQLLITATLVLGFAIGAHATEMSIQIRNAQLRASPSYLGKPTGTAAYAQRVAVLQTQGDWLEVQSGAAKGWLHKSALTTKKIVAKAGAEDIGATASGDELALAGKGFNADVEADFKEKHAKIDFGVIDRMEKIKVSAGEARDFLVDGGVKRVPGGAQ